MTLLEILHDCWNGKWEANYDFVVQNEYGLLLSCSNDNLVYRRRAGYWQNTSTGGHIHIEQHSPTMVADDFATKIVTKQEFEEARQKATKFKRMLFEPENELQSQLIQEKLFRMGYVWGEGYNRRAVANTTRPVLFTTISGELYWADDAGSVHDCERQEVAFSEVIFKPTVSLVEIDGSFYHKDEVEELLRNIKPVV